MPFGGGGWVGPAVIMGGVNSTAVVAFVIGWILVGLVTGLWMTRRGHSPIWTLIAVVLGPLFVPIAFERVERRPRMASSGSNSTGSAQSGGSDMPRMMVGLDGSPESEHALDAALDLMGNRCGTLMLAEVVSYDDAGEGAPTTVIEAACERLARDASRVVDIPTRYEVLAGPPGEALLRFAEEQAMDLLVVGRRGRGLSTRLMGSVSADLVQRARVPVLVVEPWPVRRMPPEPVNTGVVRPESPGEAAADAIGGRR